MSAYRGRRVLVLGGLGFIGSNLTARLVDAGAVTTVVTPSRERHEAAAHALEALGVSVLEGDIRDHAFVAHHVPGHSLVVNLSGQSGAVRSMEDPWTDLDVNCRGNLVLLETVRELNPSARVLFVGSRLQYGRPTGSPTNEDQAGEPLCLHAIHKQTVEEYFRLYGRLFGLRFAIARVTNPYGPGQPRGRTAYGIINRLIHLALADEALTIFGDGEQRRDYIHVDDVATALMRLGEAPEAEGRAYNVGSGTGTRMVDLARLIVALAGAGRVEHTAWPPLAGQIETGDFIADIARITAELGWTPTVALQDGLARTIAHYRADGAA